MAVLVTYTGTDARGQPQRDRRSLDGALLRVGRATDCDIHLPDAAVALVHAHFMVGDAGARIEAQSGTVEVNGRPVQSAALGAGDRITVGPYILEVDAARPGVPLALEVRRDASAARARSWRRPFRSRWALSKRRLSYLSAGAVLLLFLVLPMTARHIEERAPALTPGGPAHVVTHVLHAMSNRMAQSWNPGPVSRGHEGFGDDCGACHGFPLVQVRDAACIACHKDINQHVQTAALTGPAAHGMLQRRCAECHRDHKGQQMAPRAQELCVDCHRDVKGVAPDAASGNVVDFATDHPRFRLSMVDAATPDVLHRVRLGTPVTERSQLKFNHALHLDPRGVRDPKGKRDAAGMRNARGGRTVLKCADCHEAESDGRGMAPISMDRHCRSCHSLAFEPKLTARQVPHGSEEMNTMLAEFYARLALRDAPPAPDDGASIVRARPGGPELTYEDRQRVLQIAERKTQQALRELYETRDVCSTCHYVTRGRTGWKVAPVRITDTWMPNATFSHARHKTEACTSCHAVAQSKQAQDVAMPDIATCRQCHVGAKPVRNKVTSDCALCHRFHFADEPWDPSLQTRWREAAR